MTYSAASVNAITASTIEGASQDQVHEIVSAQFVSRGQNLIVIGGAGTSKAILANAIAQAAQHQGLTVAHLITLSAWPHDDLLEARHHAFTGWDRAPRSHRSDLLGHDLLVVDQAHAWLEAAPLVTLMLLCMRAESGKSTILVTESEQWHQMLDEGRFSRALAADNFNESSLLKELTDSEWLRFIKRSYGAMIARRELLASLGLDNIVTAPHLQRSPSRFGRNWGWHVLTMGSAGETNRLRYFKSQF